MENLELCEQENWGGLVVPKRRKRASYLQKNSEWMHIDLQQKANVVPIGILKNGNCVQLKPVKFNKKQIVLSNTCGFDSLIQMWCCCYCDNIKFANKLKSQESKLVELIQQMIKLIGVKAYKLRCSILSQIFTEHSELPNNIIHISTETTVESIIRRLCSCGEMEHSYIETIQCSKCSHMRIIPISVIPVTCNTHKNLQGEVEKYFAKRSANKICVKDNCNGSCITRISSNKSYIFIEILTYGKNSSQSFPTVPTLRLHEIPKSVELDRQEYKLSGIVSYSGPGPQEILNPNIIGHFKCYSRRISDKWEIYDSLDEHKKDCTDMEEVFPQVLFYTVY